MSAVEWAKGRTVSTVERGEGSVTVLAAHGAGTDQHHQMIVGIAEALAAAGLRVVTFNYPYAEAGRRRPDRADSLLACHRAVLEDVRSRHGNPVVTAGRSMGGRMATMLAAEGVPMAGVVAYAYPLHPAGKPDRLRIDHLHGVAVPMLFFQGERDALSRGDLFDLHIRPLPRATVVDMAGADHSFRGRGWSPDRLYPFLAGKTVEWIRMVIEGSEA
jgi:predicted alpha/beta-hydrolase family hydrolase